MTIIFAILFWIVYFKITDKKTNLSQVLSLILFGVFTYLFIRDKMIHKNMNIPSFALYIYALPMLLPSILTLKNLWRK